MKEFFRIPLTFFVCFSLLIISGMVFTVLAQEQIISFSDLPHIEGIWEGRLKVPGGELRIVLNISKTSKGIFAVTMDSPDQGVTGIPVEEIVFEDRHLQLEIKSIGGSFEANFSEDFLTLEGQWKQSGASLPLVLQKVAHPTTVSRPQEPEKPYPYIEEEISYTNDQAGITLAGTLTLPDREGTFPAVILISGSGGQDRNETVFGHKPFLVLADYLTRKGIAVLRSDDRGVGESTGDFSQATSEDFASDVLAGISYLKTRKEINPQLIGLIGHSEGGIIAPMVATQSSDVVFIILMAGPGLTGEEILYLQSDLISRAAGKSEEKITRDHRVNQKVYSLIKEEENQKIAEEKIYQVFKEYFTRLSEEEKSMIGDPEIYINAQLQSLLSPWFRYFLTYDPRPALRKLTCPVLAIIGEKDLQVPPEENLNAIKDALTAGGNKDFLVKELPNLNHLFQTAQTGSPDEYAKIEETISPVALNIMGKWILEQVESIKEKAKLNK